MSIPEILAEEGLALIGSGADFLYNTILSPPLKIAGWIPYELIFASIPYLLPSALTFNATLIEEDNELNPLSKETTSSLLKRIDYIKHMVFADVEAPEIDLYMDSKEETVGSSGGAFSIQTPVIKLPKTNGLVRFFQQENNEEVLVLDPEIQEITFDKEETEYLVIREMIQMKLHADILKIASLIVLFSLAILLFEISVPTLIASAISWSVYIVAFTSGQYQLEYRIDQLAKGVLKNLYRQDSPYLLEEALNQKVNTTMYRTYKKMKDRNLHTRENSILSKLYITPDGNNILDMFAKPPVTWREDHFGKLAGIQNIQEPLVLV